MDALLGLIGASPPIEALRGAIRKLAAHGATGGRLPTVLITGETGTGKGLIAHLIHRVSPRAEGPFVDVNCAAIPETLLEAELFGYERGAFTDAHRSKPGLLQTAHGGTIFLDEIGLLSAPLQAKLLKVTEERVVRRLGATRSEPITARLISATNADLLAATRDQRFREDLYHRLAVVTLDLPPLRDRDQDVVVLAEHFLARACHDYGLPARVLSPEARRRLLAYPWPGNVRELANVMERTALLAESTYVTAKELDLPLAVGPSALSPVTAVTSATSASPSRSGPAAPPARVPARDSSSLDGVTRAHVRAVLDECGGNISRTAAALGITRTTLRAHIRKFGLEIGAVRPAGRPRTRPLSATSVPVSPRATAWPRRPTVAEPAPTATPAAVAAGPAVSGVPVTLRWEPGLIGLLAVSLSATPETSDYQLTSLVQELMATATSFGGRVEELAPLGLVVAFGVDRIEDGPRRAAYAGLAARKAVERRQPPLPSVGIRCAIDVSRSLVAQGSAVAMDMNAKREALGGLEALLAAAGSGAVLITARAVPLLERRFELVPTARSDDHPPAFELVGRERTGLEVGGRTLSRFVGRDAELAELCDRLAEAEAGHGSVVGIVGEPGVGKSRLLYELRRSLPAERVRVVSGRACRTAARARTCRSRGWCARPSAWTTTPTWRPRAPGWSPTSPRSAWPRTRRCRTCCRCSASRRRPARLPG